MHDLITAEDIEAVWFGAAAPLALLAGRHWAERLPPAWMKRGFAVLCLLTAALMLARVGGWL